MIGIKTLKSRPIKSFIIYIVSRLVWHLSIIRYPQFTHDPFPPVLQLAFLRLARLEFHICFNIWIDRASFRLPIIFQGLQSRQPTLADFDLFRLKFISMEFLQKLFTFLQVAHFGEKLLSLTFSAHLIDSKIILLTLTRQILPLSLFSLIFENIAFIIFMTLS